MPYLLFISHQMLAPGVGPLHRVILVGLVYKALLRSTAMANFLSVMTLTTFGSSNRVDPSSHVPGNFGWNKLPAQSLQWSTIQFDNHASPGLTHVY